MILSQEVPNNLGLIVRKEFTDLRDSTIKDFETYTGIKVGSDKDVKLPNGSVIMFRHGAELDVLKNINLGWFFIEQAEEFQTEDQFEFLRGRLRRSNVPFHTGFIIGNVNGHNWIWKLWKNNLQPEFELIESNTFENADNLPKDFIADLNRLKLESPSHYQRFVMNDWETELEKAVFKRINDCIAGEIEEPKAGFSYVFGLDLAHTQDFNVITVICRETKHLVFFERWNNTSWNITVEKAKAVATKYNNALCVPDRTGVGDPIVEDLQRAGIGIYHDLDDKPGVLFTNPKKIMLIEKLMVAIEHRLITYPEIDVLLDELRAFSCELLPGGSFRYSAPEGKFDDCVISLALSVWALLGGVYEPYIEPIPKTNADLFWDRVKKDKEHYDYIHSSEDAQREVSEEGVRIV